jgi:hypothetical protein
MSGDVTEPPQCYPEFLAVPEQRIRGARLQAAVSVNREMILLYWGIGRDILGRQRSEGSGGEGHRGLRRGVSRNDRIALA